MKNNLKLIIFFSIFLIFSSFTFAIDECKGTINQDESPCMVLLPVNISITPCNTIEVSFFNESTNLYNKTMTEYSPHFCNTSFNESKLGTYNFFYSTGDTGSIMVERGLIMIYLLYFVMACIMVLFVVGKTNEDYTFLSLSGILLMIFGLYIFANGFNGLNNLMVDAMSIIAVLAGFWIMIGSIYEFSDISTTG